MSQTTNLILPYVAAGQAQKHVTVNESLRRLDAVVQLSVASATTSAQPVSPADGAVWIVPSGKTGTQWAPMTNWSLAYYRDGAWEQIIPREGWLAWVQDDAEFLYFDGAAWEPLPGGGGGASDADDVTFDPTGLDVITATDVQAALEELDAAVDGLSGGGGGGYTDEMARDAIGAALVAGSNITITVNDGADTITIAASGGSYTDEMAQDAAAALFTPDDGDIDFTYNDATPSITAAIKAGAVGTAELADDAVTFDKLLNATGAGFIGATGSGAFVERTPAQARDLIGLDTDDTVQFTGINLGHATDTTITRSAAGVVAVEGVDLGMMDAPQNLSLDAGNYTLALSDRGKSVDKTTSSTRTLTIPANASVAFPVGTIITGSNEGSGALTIAITSDTLRWGSSTGSRTVAQHGSWTLRKISATVWRLVGDGIT